MSNLFPGRENKKLKSIENTEDDKTFAEDDNEDTSGAMKNRFEKISVTVKRGGKKNDKKFGLGIVLVHQRILVCKVESDSLVDGVLRCGDQILQVDKKGVVNKNECKKRLIDCLKEKGSVEIQIIRPKTSDAITLIEQEIKLSMQPGL